MPKLNVEGNNAYSNSKKKTGAVTLEALSEKSSRYKERNSRLNKSQRPY